MARDEVQVDHLVFVYRVEIHFGVVGCLSTNDYSTRLCFCCHEQQFYVILLVLTRRLDYCFYYYYFEKEKNMSTLIIYVNSQIFFTTQ